MKSRLVVNLSMLGDKPTGLGVYSLACANIVKRIKAVVVSRPDVVPSGAAETIHSPTSISFGGGFRAAIMRQAWLRSLRFDANHLVYSPTHHGLPSQDGQVITIHDMICLRFPRQHLFQYLFFKYFIPLLLKRCRAVFTVSEATRKDIIKNYSYPADKVFVVPNSVDTSIFVPGEVEKKDPYLLMIGASYPHKNVDEVLFNSDLWRDRYRLLVTSCKGKYRNHLEKKIDALGLRSRVQFLEYVSIDNLVKLYQGCTALIYPSRWEGFGIPLLEALSCGRPVIASDIEAHREVLMDAGIYITLGDRESWRKAIASLTDEAIIDDKLNHGRKRVEYYSGERTISCLFDSLLAVEPTLDTCVMDAYEA